MTPQEKREIYKRALSIRDTDDIDLIRSVSCKFFQDGDCPRVYSSQCKGCLDDDSVIACRGFYLDRIFDRPQEKWSPEFDEPVESTNKVTVDNAKSLGLVCDTCYVRNTCQFFKPNTKCSIDWKEEQVDPNDDKALITTLIRIQQERVNKLRAFENVDGGMTDMNLSAEIDRLESLISKRDALGMVRFSATAQIPKSSSDSGGGILSSIFGGGKSEEIKSKELPENNVDYVDFEEVQEAEKIKANVRNNKSPKRSIRKS